MKHVVTPPARLGKVLFPFGSLAHPFGEDRDDREPVHGQAGILLKNGTGRVVFEWVLGDCFVGGEEWRTSGQSDDWLDIKEAFSAADSLSVRGIVLDIVAECTWS